MSIRMSKLIGSRAFLEPISDIISKLNMIDRVGGEYLQRKHSTSVQRNDIVSEVAGLGNLRLPGKISQ